MLSDARLGRHAPGAHALSFARCVVLLDLLPDALTSSCRPSLAPIGPPCGAPLLLLLLLYDPSIYRNSFQQPPASDEYCRRINTLLTTTACRFLRGPCQETITPQTLCLAHPSTPCSVLCARGGERAEVRVSLGTTIIYYTGSTSIWPT